MTKKKKWLLVSACALSLALGCGLYAYGFVLRPQLQMRHLESFSVDQQRAICHRVISTRFSNPHDAFLVLGSIGNKESVPLLIQALEWQHPSEEGPYACTIGHGIGALKQVAGMDFGVKVESWKAWWENTGRQLPDAYFTPRIPVRVEQSAEDDAHLEDVPLPAPAGL